MAEGMMNQSSLTAWMLDPASQEAGFFADATFDLSPRSALTTIVLCHCLSKENSESH